MGQAAQPTRGGRGVPSLVSRTGLMPAASTHTRTGASWPFRFPARAPKQGLAGRAALTRPHCAWTPREELGDSLTGRAWQGALIRNASWVCQALTLFGSTVYLQRAQERGCAFSRRHGHMSKAHVYCARGIRDTIR